MSDQPVDAASMTMADLGPLEAFFCEDYPPTWLELATSLYTRMSAIQPAIAKPERMAEIALLLTRQLAQDFGGQTLYISTGAHFNAKQMANKVRIEFKGNNLRQLSIKWGVTEMRIRQIVGI